MNSAPVVSYSAVAEIAAPLAIPKKKVVEKKADEEEYETDSDEYIEEDDDSVHKQVSNKPVNYDNMTLKEKLMSYYENDNNDW